MEQEKGNISVSIVIPLYNKEEHIQRTLLSVLNQSFQFFEIVVVDDGSSDNSLECVKQIEDERISIISQSNQGVSAARNRGIQEAKFNYIALLDADDEWDSGYLTEQVNLISKYPDCSVFACAYQFKSYTGKVEQLKLNKVPFTTQTGILTNYFEVASCSHPPLWTSAVVVEKQAILAVGGFPVGVKSGEDLLTWAKLAIQYKMAYSRKVCADFVLDESHSIDKKPLRVHDSDDFVGSELKNLYKNSIPPVRSSLKKYLSLWYKMKASGFLRLSDKSGTIKYSLVSIRYNPRNWKVYIFILMVLLPQKVQIKVRKMLVNR